MQVRFWGTRGSIATPGPQTVRYGGNTSCVEVQTADGTLLVLDAGTGLRALGDALLARPGAARRGHILISHTHWDHIQGFPFFKPLFESGNQWDVYAPRGFGASLRDTLAGQMQYTYFPVALEALGASIHYHDLVEGSFTIGGVRVTAHYLNHPALTLGYRIEADGSTLVYATDHECHARASALGRPLGQVLQPLHPGDSRHLDFIAGADLLVHDTQYTAAEYPSHAGWGHSTLEYVVDLAVAGGVRRLELFHHDPARDDAAVDALLAAGRKRVADAGARMEISAASEGRMVELAPRSMPPWASAAGGSAEAPIDTDALAAQEVLIACPDAVLADRLRATVQEEGLSAILVSDRAEALQQVQQRPIAMAIVAPQDGDDGARAWCRELRSCAGMSQLPVILVAPTGSPAPLRTPAEPGPSPVTDWLTAPFTPQYLRTRLRAGLLRSRARWQSAPAPVDEQRRLAALRGLALLDSPPEERFDRITRLAARLFDVPVALITLVDQDRQWFKSRHGMVAQQTSREESFCAHAILGSQTLVVADALGDDRFADNPAVQSGLRVRFYAGHPIAARDGSAVGTLCLVDHQPRDFGESERAALMDLAALVERELHAGA